MKFAAKFFGMGALMLLVSMSLSAQKPADMVGTWSGLATLEGTGGPNELALVLELKEGKLAGHMTDQYGTMNQAPISEITLDQGTLTFTVSVAGPGGAQFTLKFKMKVSGDAMKGELEVPKMGAKGTWEAAKKK
jgi:hypothetical protein